MALRIVLLSILIGLNACSSGGGGGGRTNAKPVEFTESPELAAPETIAVRGGNQKAIIYWTPVANATSYNLYWHITPGVNKSNGNRIVAVNPGYVHDALINGDIYYYVVTTVVDNGESLPSAWQPITPQAIPIAGLFDDVNLQHCVDALAATQGWVFADDIVGELDCSFRGIVSLAGAENLIRVQYFNLSNNHIDDITPLSALLALQSINLSYNNIAQLNNELISQFDALKGLAALSLKGNLLLDCQQLAYLIDTVKLNVLDIATPQQDVNCKSYTTTPPPTNSEPTGDDNAGNDGTGSDGSGDDGTGNDGTGDSGAGNGNPDDTPAPGGGSNDAADNTSPQNVMAIPGNGQVTLYWDNVADASGYSLYWSSTPSINLATASKVENVTPGHVQTQLTNETPYYFVLTATIASVASAASEEVSAIPSDQGVLLSTLFTDNALQVCIDQIASAKGWTFAHELVGHVDCSSRTIKQLAGVEQLVNIIGLNVFNNQITDVLPLATLTGLKQLYLNDNQLNAIGPLSGVTALTYLNLRNNQLTDISAISSLVNLSQLYMNNNTIIDASPIAALTALQTLDLRDNALGGDNVGNIDALVTLTNATSIRLLGNINLACNEVISLIDALGEQVVDLSATLDQINCVLPPQTPVALIAEPSNQRILLNWDKTPRATEYNLYWSDSPNIDITTTVPVSVTSSYYAHTNLSNDVTYYYVISAVNTAGESPPTEEISATPALVPIAGSFTDVNLQACIDAFADLNTWTTTDQITGFLNCSSQGIAILEGVQHLTSVTELALNQNVITNIDALATLTQLQSLSLYGNSLSKLDVISALTALTTLNLSNNQLKNIRPLSALTALNQLDLSNNNIGERGIGDVDDLVTLVNATDIKLAGNVNIACSDLVILLQALGAGVVDLSEPLDSINCTASSIIPTSVRAVSGNNQISLSWNPVDTALDYRVYWDTSPGVDPGSATSAVATTTAYLHTGLTNDTTYYYKVTARRNTGEGTPSVEVASVPSASGVSIRGLIPDDALRSCVESVANRKGWKLAHEITGAINCSSRNVAELAGLEHLISLQSLRLGSNGITNLAALSGLSSIEFLDLFNNSITDISGLAGLNNLATLYLHTNNITDISALSGLASLTYVILDENNISDATPLLSVTALQRLFFRKNKLSNINALAALTQLTHLYLNDNLVVDVSPLANMTLLQQLDLRNNKVGGLGLGNLDSLSPLTNISRIYVAGNNTISCTELDNLVVALGPAIVDIGAPNDGVNCVNP